ncbi:MAG TPA: SprT family zinc-dependent metalloprotease [Pelomicrobium sp.]|nr:SprT family zinc-dependent metalloprotease [Pelomicrobium sp.]
MAARSEAKLRVTRLDDREVPYVLTRRRRMRNVVMRIDGESLQVSAPYGASVAAIEAVLTEKALWILKRLAEAAARPSPQMAWSDGDAVPWLGGTLTLRLETAARLWPVERVGGTLVVSHPQATSPAVAERLVTAWYDEQALAIFRERAAALAPALEVTLPVIRLSSSRSEWGSCSSGGRVLLNRRLLHLPPHLVDYVIAHELAHLRELNHSPRFWALVARVCPEHRALRRELRRYG